MTDDPHAAFVARATGVFRVASPAVIGQRYYAADRQQLRQKLTALFGHITDNAERLIAGITHLRERQSHDYASKQFLAELINLEERLCRAK